MKNPKTKKGFPCEFKVPKTSELEKSYQRSSFKWAVESVQLSGDFGFHNCDHETLFKTIINRLKQFETMNWSEVIKTHSHEIDFNDVIPSIQIEIRTLFDDELNLFSMRMAGRPRVWGVRKGAICYILFYDPDHEICPSSLKHT